MAATTTSRLPREIQLRGLLGFQGVAQLLLSGFVHAFTVRVP